MKKETQQHRHTVTPKDTEHTHGHHGENPCHGFLAPALSLTMLVAGVLMSHFGVKFFDSSITVQYLWYGIAFLPVGLPVIKEAVAGIMSGNFFNEFTLMTIACAGAFCIKELPEAVGVMLFYSIGETLQHGAVDRATRNISRLLDVREEKTQVLRDGKWVTVDPRKVMVGEIIEVRPGERVPLDGSLEGTGALFDTSALTGESVPREISAGDEVLSGMISSHENVRIKVTREYADSTLSRILEMVNDASSRKAHAELFIRKFARIYTPVVIILAVLVLVIPAIIGLLNPAFHFVFSQWLYRALVFLVISCPCALVISIPLGYYAGIGAASHAGILFKGGNYLEAITKVDTVAFDKTGTLTTGKFGVTSVVSPVTDSYQMLALMAAAESGSSHPIAKALVEYVTRLGIPIPVLESMKEKAGYGTTAYVDGHTVVTGNLKMMKQERIGYPSEIENVEGTVIVCGIDGGYCGYVVLADTLKPDAKESIAELHNLGIDRIIMLSGDKKETVRNYAAKLGITEAYGEMLPQDKAAFVEKISDTPGHSIAFVGDGMNDAPVLAVSNVGVAMGTLGSDAAIESADVVIQTDNPSRLATAIKIGRATRTIVTENIIGAISIKTLILVLGAFGYASLWAAVFADVGVALLAVLNSMRIMWKKY